MFSGTDEPTTNRERFKRFMDKYQFNYRSRKWDPKSKFSVVPKAPEAEPNPATAPVYVSAGYGYKQREGDSLAAFGISQTNQDATGGPHTNKIVVYGDEKLRTDILAHLQGKCTKSQGLTEIEGRDALTESEDRRIAGQSVTNANSTQDVLKLQLRCTLLQEFSDYLLEYLRTVKREV